MFNFASGGMLTGAEIEKQIRKGRINISPYDPKQLNPNSYNLKLHPQLLVYKRNWHRCHLIPMDQRKSDYYPNILDPKPKNTMPKSILHENRKEGKSLYSAEPGIANMTTCVDNLETKIKSEFADLYMNPTMESLKLEPIDMKKPNETIEFTIPEEGYVLQPGILYIGRTVERTASDFYIPMINGRSSGGRLGISIHICAGFGDVGFDGTWTLEIACVEPVRIYPNTEIAQVCYFKPVGKIGKLYRGRYFGQQDATASRFYRPKEDY